MASGLFRTKSIDKILAGLDQTGHELRRTLGPVQLTMLGIGAIIGAGIYTAVGTAAAGDAARVGAGPGLILSFFITAIVCGFTALCYAEFASMVPISGSAYTYSYATLGELAAWIIGWNLVIEYAIGSVAVSISWSNYFRALIKGLFNLNVPQWLSMDYRTAITIVDANGVRTVIQNAPHIFGMPIVFNLISVLIVSFITIVLIWGIRESARFNAAMVIIKIVILSFFVMIGAFFVKPENWQPFAPNGFAGISSGAAIVFFAYIGFDAVSTVAEETKNPKRNIPIGIIASLIICSIFYIVVAAIFTGLIPYTELKAKLATEQAEPLTMSLRYAYQLLHPGKNFWVVPVVACGAIAAQTAVLLVMQMSLPRIFFSMGRDGLLPGLFYKVHPRFKTPYISTIIVGVIVALFSAFTSVSEMMDLTNIGTLTAFILVSVGIIVLRVKDPDRPRPFRVPGGWLWAGGLWVLGSIAVLFIPMSITAKIIFIAIIGVLFGIFRNLIMPILGVVSCLYLVIYLPPTSWLRFAVWLYIGLVIYISYGALKSKLIEVKEGIEIIKRNINTTTASVWLSILGTVVLFFTKSMDLWRHAWLQSAETATASEKFGAVIDKVFSAGSWTTVSWVLAIPLLYNILVLCPMLINKLLKLNQQAGAEPGIRQKVTNGIVLTGVLALFSIFYILIVSF